MNIMKILTDPAILVVLGMFFGIIIYYLKKLKMINTDLVFLLTFLKKFKKSDLAFRFKEFDSGMESISFVAPLWADFKNTLMFSESFSVKNENDDVVFQNISQSITNIQTTVDPAVFFNEDSLAVSRLNHKFIQTAPTILTGMGPLFTFLNLGIAFSQLDFSTPDGTLASIARLMGSMQIAASVSVLAVSSSLIFLLIERTSWNIMCKTILQDIQSEFNKIFENISSEKFLIELLKETKIQNNNTKNLLSVMPMQFKTAMDKSLSTILVPYLENIIFGLNKLQEKTVSDAKKGGDVIDDLF